MTRLRFSADIYSGHGQALLARGVALAAACVRLGLETPVQGTARLFASNATGLIVKLPGWTYPAVIDTVAGEVQFDNYGGAWGQQKELDRLLQAYAVEKARIEARKLGHSVTEQALADVTAGGEGIDQLMSPPDYSKAGFATPPSRHGLTGRPLPGPETARTARFCRKGYPDTPSRTRLARLGRR